MRTLFLAGLALLLPGAALAGAPQADLVQSVTACRSVADPAARLACYDKAAGDLATAQEKKEIVVLDKAEVKKTRRSLFGFTLPRVRFLEGDGADTPDEEIETTVESVQSLGYGKWSIRTAEGATWQSTEPLSDTPRAGAKLTIKRGALGSFIIKVDKQKAARAKRVG
jgi:hypothetical protein